MTPPMTALFNRIIGKESAHQYNEILKRFAIELDFISPRAYRFVRAQSGNNLPNPRTIGGWFESIDCDPGLTKESFELLKSFCANEKSQGRQVICQLVFDEVFIFTHVQRIGSKIYGEPSFGDVAIQESTTAAAKKKKTAKKKSKGATQILLFMLVSIDMRWKIPVGYFPIDTLYADQKAELILKTIYRAEDAGVVVLGLTFDGSKVNFSAMRMLGVDLEEEKEVYSFSSPDISEGNSEENVIFAYPDPCHMVKLIRNVFGEHKMIDGEGREICFKFILELFNLQRSVGMNFNNKLKIAHIEFDNRKMNVRLATQLLSNSVAEDIDMCRNELQLPQFSGSEGTTNFIKIINASFDVLNSRNASQIGYKNLINEENITSIENFCKETISYINNLQLLSNSITSDDSISIPWAYSIPKVPTLTPVIEENTTQKATLS
uniref:THAP-type domain-containing protein n=1 Tax=Phlebotomus papatasi TaxID=29031 RepID=A0A1B0DJI0_PHLPP